jgi:predicted amidohydrolase YtcJ
VRSAAAGALAGAVLAALVNACTSQHAEAAADLVILGGDVQTMNAAQPQASALAVRDGTIVYVGSDQAARGWIGGATRVVQLAGATVLPGLIDSHIHAMAGALDQTACTFNDQPLPVAQLAPIIHACAARKPGASLLEVQYLNAAGFHADRHDLDAILPDRPLLLSTSDGHEGWVNSAALQRAGITRATADPPTGRIVRDSHGEATGFLIEAAQGLVTRLMDHPSDAQREGALLPVLDALARAGITSFLEANTSEDTVRTYVQLARRDRLHAHVAIALQSAGTTSDAEFARLKSIQALAAGEPLLRANLIKLYADGGLEYPTQTAALLEPYLDGHGKPGSNRGPTYIEPAAFTQFVRRADAEGFGIHVHAIGDRAARIALDAFADARAHGSQRSYSIAHLELVDPSDLPRFRALKVYASLQLQWAQPNNYSIEAVLPYIGAARHARLYPARALKAAGATITGGSDWDVSTFNPFEAMAVAISRCDPQAPQRGALGADQTLPLHDLFAAYTINAARMLGWEHELGSLEPGKEADIVVLDRRLDDASTAAQVLATTVHYTFMNGQALVTPGAR